MSDLQNKRVSVVIPNYNYGKYMGIRLDSIMRQTYPIYELIILDDASHDNSDAIIKKKMAEINRKFPSVNIKYVRNDRNSGKPILQWKRGIELASGDYVWIAEADDLCRKNFLKEVMEGFNDKDVVLSYAESAIINGVGVMMAPNFRWSRDKEKTGHYENSYVKDGKQEIKEIMAIRCTIPNVSAVVFKKDKRLLKYLDEAARFAQVGDWYFYINVLEGGKIAYNKKSLNAFRVHGGSVTHRSRSGTLHYKEVKEMHEMLKSCYDFDDDMIYKIDREEARIKDKHGIID